MANSDYVLKHLEMTEAIITRMASNSFILKGSLVAIIFTIAQIESVSVFTIFVAFIPIVIFWVLDAYYLRQERLFRRLFAAIRSNLLQVQSASPVDLFSMDTRNFDSTVPTVVRLMFSRTVWPVPVAVALISFMLLFPKLPPQEGHAASALRGPISATEEPTSTVAAISTTEVLTPEALSP